MAGPPYPPDCGNGHRAAAARLAVHPASSSAETATPGLPGTRSGSSMPALPAEAGLQGEVVLADYLRAERAAGLVRIIDAAAIHRLQGLRSAHDQAILTGLHRTVFAKAVVFGARWAS